ncbi:MAG: hypothetical protein DID92_2727745766 [Candidatus Nitrotoga sp. SPKER]|uniref:hypothetical protein n=1 Tax=Candidatus Nitrotoga sp. HW29 TaxID=2886963 RepID=UPI000E38F95E|nr:hypothetical protein [Candidatus Nitrotoga sp. HW29]RFC31755.1 MAG: hypothetical protein DID92_2727745766 [Candidatus Nitrotoga sp. SPKER]
MGILILFGIALAVYWGIRVVVAFINSRARAKLAAEIKSASMPNEQNWAGLDTPTFIRRGIAIPILAEKKKKRIRRAKAADAPACVN